MNRVEVLELFIEIKEEYPFFDDSDENVERHRRYLADFPFDAAMENVKRHIMTNSKRPPGIADIRGGLGDQLDSQRSKEEAEAYFAQVELWRQNSSPPPEGYWQRVRQQLRGGNG